MTYREALEDIERRIHLMDIKKSAMRHYSKVRDNYLSVREYDTSHITPDYSPDSLADYSSYSEDSGISHKAFRSAVHINIPAGAMINVLNLFELSSPTGISLDVTFPFLDKNPFAGFPALAT